MNGTRRAPWEPLEDTVPAEVFRAEVAAWARRIGVEPRRVSIRRMKTKWGSCSTRGALTFNSELLTQPAALRRRVIVEELLRSIARVVRDEGMSAIIVEQNPRMILPITHTAVVLDRGAVVHRGDSEALLADPATLDKWLAVASH